MTIEQLPQVNATLNGIATILLVAGWVAIKTRRITLHKALMVSAFVTSALFLVTYLTYHFNVPSKPFPDVPYWRPFYLYVVLIPHIILAVVMLPMIFRTFWLAYRERFDAHRRLARWTLPIWLYVSVTGVVVYVMLYRIDWGV